jgi:hypothetical protein
LLNCSPIVKYPLFGVELYVLVQPFVNPVHLVLYPLLGLTQYLEQADDYLMVGMVLPAELLDDGDYDATDCRYCRSNNERGIGVHVTPQAQDV